MPIDLLVGTYTSRESEGIYAASFDPAARTFSLPSLAARATNPSFLLAARGGRHVYAVNELWEWEGRPGGGVSAFSRDPGTQVLEPLGSQPSHGADPCHLSLHESGRFLFVSNFTGGSVAVLPLRPDGGLEQASDVVEHSGRGIHPRRQAGPHPHSTLPMPGGRFLLAADLGLDEITVSELSASSGTLRRVSSVRSAAGAGPRHLAPAPAGQVACSNEIDSSVSVYRWDAGAGELAHVATEASIPDGWDGLNSGSDLHAHPSGGWLYASNRGHDSIAAFSAAGGGLERLGAVAAGGAKPRGFCLSGDGAWLFAACQDSDLVTVLPIDPRTGIPGEPIAAVRIPSPSCVLAVEASP